MRSKACSTGERNIFFFQLKDKARTIVFRKRIYYIDAPKDQDVGTLAAG